MQQPTTVQGFAERIARVIHEDYLGSLPIGQRGTSRSAVAWEDLPEEAKEQCTSDALRIPDVLAAVGLALQEGHPTPDQGANAARVIEENLETLAEAEHERWLEQKRREGWRYGPVVNREARTHNFLVPYESLPEAEKDKSRNAILRYTGIAQRAGYRIVPAGPGEGARW